MFSCKINADSELRLIVDAHAEELNDLVIDNYEHIREWSAWLTEKERTAEQTREWIGQNLRRFAAGEGFEIGVWHKGRMAGQIGYNYFDRANRRTEIGFWLGADFQGKGLITNACISLINNAFDNLKMNRIEMRCGTENSKSRRIPQKLGFTEEGIARETEWLHGRFIDHAIYAMLASDWKPYII